MKITYSFSRYLTAKKSVEDRALNRHVWHTMTQALPEATPASPLRVLEIGAGTGMMAERMVAWGALTHAAYTAIDANPANIEEAQRRLQTSTLPIRVELEAVDFFDFVAQQQGRQWDLLVAHAFLDLVNVPQTLPQLFSLLRPGGLFYFPINFDGVTTLLPTIDRVFDAQVEKLYHQTMDKRLIKGNPSGDSRTGRRLFQQIRAAGGEIMAAGSSDWVVFPVKEGYPADEAYFLHHIIHTIENALAGHPHLSATLFNAWIAQRHAQVKAGTLIYIAHQLDFLGRYQA